MKIQWQSSIIVALILLFTMSNVALGQERTISAMAPWQGSGEVFAVGPDKLLFQGSFSGILYYEGREGDLDTALMLCPFVQNIDTKSAKTNGSGHCIIGKGGEEVVFADFECAGAVGACLGDFKITGGTGKFDGISGGGAFIIRSALIQTAAGLETGGTIKNATGLAIWPELKYTIPAK